MNIKVLTLTFFILFIASSAVLPNPILGRPQNQNFASARSKVEKCKNQKCSPTDSSPKFKASQTLRDYAAHQYSKLRVKPLKDDIDKKFNEFSQRAGKNQTQSQKQRKLFLSRAKTVRSNAKVDKQFPKSLLSLRKEDSSSDLSLVGSGNARFLQSQNNQYPQYNEGNIQANLGNRCIYRLKWDYINGNQYIRPVIANANTVSNGASLVFGSNFYAQQIHATNNFLVVVGYFWNSYNNILIYKIPINPNTCSIDLSNYAYYLKRGSLVSSTRQRNGRLIIVTQQQLSNHDYDWNIYEFGTFGIYQANNYGFTTGVYQNVIRSVWNIPISYTQNDFYFEQYYFADWSYTINIQSSNILYITSYAWSGSTTFNVQAIQSAINNPFGSYANSANYPGYVFNSLAEDQYGNVFRIISVDWSAGYNVYGIQLTVPDLNLLGNPTIITYPGQYLTSCLFVNDYVYLIFNSIIRATFLVGGTATSTDFPISPIDQIQSLFKFQTGWIVGFGYNKTQYSPIVNLYKISTSTPLSLIKRYQITQASGVIGASFWNHQGFLINPTTNTIVFDLYNYNPLPSSAVMSQGLYYLHVHTNGCIGPLPLPATCPPGPPPQPFGPVYKHYPSGTYQTGQSQYVERFTILQQNGQSYLYSSSNGQMQARKISQTNNLPQIFAPTSSAVFL